MSISPHKILVCDKAGQPHHWTSAEDAICLSVKDCLSYSLGDASIFNGGVSRMTGKRSHVDITPIVFLREVLKYDARIPPLTNQNLFARDRNICGFCGRHFPEHKLSRDHIQPVSKGGKNVWQNVITSCKSCNHEKADMTLKELGWELLMVPYQPNHSERLLMQNRNILADQHDFLRAFLPAHSRLH